MAAAAMWPKPGEHLLRFVGDRLRVILTPPAGLDPSARGYLRTNLTRAGVARAEVVAQAGLRGEDALTFAGASWRDIPLVQEGEGWALDLPLLEVGHFRAKAYLADPSGRQVWPEGGDVGISVHPDHLRSANLIYCVFPRTIKSEQRLVGAGLEDAVRALDERGFSVIPPSGTLRALTQKLPHIFDTLGCRILHLLPIGPVPATYARMGRFGSPYAQLDLTGIDPALVEFDKRSTAVDQFCELADGVHLRGGLLLLDVVLNHTGWSSRLMEEHPEWFVRGADGTFHSPGAWGNTWADLVELDQSHSALWDVLAEGLLVWCRRGVDGFRCDAGYMIPLRAWQYVVARVREQFPDAVFLLEGLGGAWEATENLLSAGGMQWAYSELFQCFEPRHVAEYLDHANRQSRRIGELVHYSETHDNDRLAKRGARWAAMRNQLCALASHSGGFGFSAGVEWLSTTKFDVHEAHPLSWGASPNLIDELARLTRLLRDHPCFFDGAEVERVSPLDSPVLALTRVSADGQDRCLVLVNLDVDAPHDITLPHRRWQEGGEKLVDLLAAHAPAAEWLESDVRISLAAGQACCLVREAAPRGLSGELYREHRAQAAWAYTQLAHVLPQEQLGPADFSALAQLVAADPAAFLARLPRLDAEQTRADLLGALASASGEASYPCVVRLCPEDARRVTLLPPEHFLLIEDEAPFEARIGLSGGDLYLRSTRMQHVHVVALPPQGGDVEVDIPVYLERFGRPGQGVSASVRKLAQEPRVARGGRDDLVLLSNGRGAMARIYADLGRVRSKYDCLLGANLHPEFPVDRHIMIKRVRAWVNADGFITALDEGNLLSIEPGPPALWTFEANAGDGRRVGIRLSIGLVEQQNTVVLRLSRVAAQRLDLPSERRVAVTLRFDLEDRNFHADTQLDAALKQHFAASVQELPERRGFVFAPADSRRLRITLDRGEYHAESEWHSDIAHDLDAERGMHARGAAFSPGWFELPLAESAPLTVVCSLESQSAAPALDLPPAPAPEDFEAALRRAATQFVVKRGQGRTVIAGYPWFLDWGRDTFVAARGLIAAGYHGDVRDMLLTYAALERRGTLPNYYTGAGEGSRETSDAPLWFALACEELAEELGSALYDVRAEGGRSLRDVLVSIASGLVQGAENGVRVDLASGLVYSPPHFTWMDTNYPAGTPREGYPIEIAALFIRLLSQLQRLDVREIGGQPVHELALRALASLELFWRPELGFFADTLHATPGVSARDARPDDHLRPNQLLAISLGLVSDERARSALAAAGRYLLVPGALRTLAPLPVHDALPIRGRDGGLLNDPARPYWPRYEGDEDTRRKPAYHNGTAWPWWLPTYCEALAHAYAGDPRAQRAARAILGSTARLLGEDCLGQLPEILDGDAPHGARGCDAQAWSVTETLRCWLVLHEQP